MSHRQNYRNKISICKDNFFQKSRKFLSRQDNFLFIPIYYNLKFHFTVDYYHSKYQWRRKKKRKAERVFILTSKTSQPLCFVDLQFPNRKVARNFRKGWKRSEVKTKIWRIRETHFSRLRILCAYLCQF